jgi:hypothetical protein
VPAQSRILDIKREHEQVIDEVSQDEVLEAGVSEQARAKGRALVTSFERFLEEHKDEIEAPQFFYAQPYGKRLRFKDIRALADVRGASARARGRDCAAPGPSRSHQAYHLATSATRCPPDAWLQRCGTPCPYSNSAIRFSCFP